MLILGFSTSDEECGIAIQRGGAIIGSDTFAGARSCLEELTPRTEKLLATLEISIRDIDKFAVDAGPGGLAGIKIGLSTVKTLAQLTGRPIVAVSSLLSISHAAAAAGAVPPGGLLLPLVNCSRNEFFCALFRRSADGSGVERLIQDRLCDPDILRGLLSGLGEGGELLALGNAAGRLRPAIEETLGARARFAEPPLGRPRAEVICEIAAALDGVPYNEAQPNYLCLSNAERNFGVRP
ncbi:MAG: tRNA (adenosine(37)-N6)-threonylcarbamoyltransferase complex dimerization subunit type 1 TsaB [bacterium]